MDPGITRRTSKDNIMLSIYSRELKEFRKELQAIPRSSGPGVPIPCWQRLLNNFERRVQNIAKKAGITWTVTVEVCSGEPYLRDAGLFFAPCSKSIFPCVTVIGISPSFLYKTFPKLLTDESKNSCQIMAQVVPSLIRSLQLPRETFKQTHVMSSDVQMGLFFSATDEMCQLAIDCTIAHLFEQILLQNKDQEYLGIETDIYCDREAVKKVMKKLPNGDKDRTALAAYIHFLSSESRALQLLKNEGFESPTPPSSNTLERIEALKAFGETFTEETK